MRCRRQHISHIYYSFSFIVDEWNDLSVGVPIKQPDGNAGQQITILINKLEISFFFYRKYIFFQEGCFFTVIWVCSPLPLLPADVIGRIFEGCNIISSICIPAYGIATMVKMEMCKYHISDILYSKSKRCKRFIET